VVRPLAVVVAGTLVTVGVARITAMSGDDALELSAIATGAALLTMVAGLAVVHGLRHRSFTTQIAVAALVALGTVVAGTWAAAQAMFVSDQELGALAVILCAAATVATTTALLVGRRIGGDVDLLVGTARRLGDESPATESMPHRLPAELARLRDELDQTRARLDASRRRERALDISRRELIAWVSHDLRTPLAGIRALAEALEDGVASDPETITRYYTALSVETERLSGLVDDLFELSRTQAGVLHLELQRVSLHDLVSDAIASATPIAEAKGVHLHGRIARTPPELMASTPEVLRALRNILENAIRHTPSDGTITVEAGADDASAYVSIADTGGGIPDDDLPHIFEVAFRGDPARTPGDGAGLGLAIAQGLIEAHRGKVSVRNDNGGARFTVSLPLH
jgi:signal transduction histidine kinase